MISYILAWIGIAFLCALSLFFIALMVCAIVALIKNVKDM